MFARPILVLGRRLTALCQRRCQANIDVMKLVRRKLAQINEEYYQLDQKLTDGKSSNPNSDRKRLNQLSSLVTLHERVDACYKNLEELQAMKTAAEKDRETQDFVREEETKTIAELKSIEAPCLEQLIEPSLYDDYNDITLELRPGVGGSESSLFVEDVAQMYQSYFEHQGWSTRITEAQRDFNANKGYKYFSVKVTGEGVYRIMKCQSGVHKVIRVPQTEARGRLHSSTISVVVMPTVPFDFAVNDKDIKYEYMRSQGAGGQHVNKTESACRATHIPTGLTIFIQDFRVQEQNRRRATELLKQKVFEQEYQKNMDEEAQRRKVQIGSGDRSEKIRTYNFPQDRITDHRTALTMFGIRQMLLGDYLPQFIEAYQKKLHVLKLEQLLNELKK